MAVITYRQALHDTLREEMLADEDVFLIGEEIGVFEGSYKITAGLLDEFGEKRVRDTPIAEEGFVGAAVPTPTPGLGPVRSANPPSELQSPRDHVCPPLL